MNVRNMKTARGNDAANQFEIWDSEGCTFQSYSSKIARIDNSGVTLFYPYWNFYSATTNRYLLRFLNEDSIKTVREKVKSGEYRVN